MQIMYKCNTEVCLHKPLLMCKSNKHYIFWVCVCSLRYPAWNAAYCIILSSVACLALPCFSKLSHKWRDNKHYIFWVCVRSLCYPAWNATYCIILSSVACLALPCFSKLSHKWRDIRKKKLLNIRRVFWFPLQILSSIFLILRRTEWDITINIHMSSCKLPITLVKF